MPQPLVTVKNLEKFFINNQHRVEVLKNLDLELSSARIPWPWWGLREPGNRPCSISWGPWIDLPAVRCLFEGQNIFEQSAKDLARFRNQKIGFVFQFHHLLPEFTALENTMMPLLIAGEGNREAQGRAEEILDPTGSERAFVPPDRRAFGRGTATGGHCPVFDPWLPN